jgi:hypothetical protein
MATTSELGIAYRRARERVGDDAWFELEMPKRVEEIEAELQCFPDEPADMRRPQRRRT